MAWFLAVQEKVVRGETGVSVIEVGFPEQMVSEGGATVKSGAGITGTL